MRYMLRYDEFTYAIKKNLNEHIPFQDNLDMCMYI